MPAPNDFEVVFRDLNAVLLNQGWLFGPQILGGELDDLWDRCERFRATPPENLEARKAAERSIDDAMFHYVSRPFYRAHYVCLAMRQPFVQHFSHLIETGVLHYYRRDFLSAVHCLLPAIEGVVRAHYFERMQNPPARPSHRQLREFVGADNRPVRTYPERHVLYRTTLAEFLRRWLWVATDGVEVDWDLSYLNRHYALHGMGPNHYYRSEDCHRLLIFLDVYMEMLVLETRIGEGMTQATDPVVRRARHYQGQLVWSEATRTESRHVAFLREHPHYHFEDVREPLIHRVMRWMNRIRR